MDNSLDKGIEAWEAEGGAVSAPLVRGVISISRLASPETLGRTYQVRSGKFDRVLRSSQSGARKQSDQLRGKR